MTYVIKNQRKARNAPSRQSESLRYSDLSQYFYFNNDDHHPEKSKVKYFWYRKILVCITLQIPLFSSPPDVVKNPVLSGSETTPRPFIPKSEYLHIQFFVLSSLSNIKYYISNFTHQLVRGAWAGETISWTIMILGLSW